MKLSIITVNLNNAAGLRKTIESVANQTYTDFEHIFIDGGSYDGSIEVIKEYAKKNTYWISEPDAGIYSAMNKGIKVSTGEYLLFLNSGDILYEKDTLENIHHKMVNKFCIYYGNCQYEKGCIIAPDHFNLKQYIFGNWISHQTSFIPKYFFNKLGMYDESYLIAADKKFFMLAAINKGKFENLHETICFFDNNGISNEIKYLETKKIENIRMYNELFTGFELLLIKKAVIFFRIIRIFKKLNTQTVTGIIKSKTNKALRRIHSFK
jgi:glycosyltransferase involved in cell wall biosynthesis